MIGSPSHKNAEAVETLAGDPEISRAVENLASQLGDNLPEPLLEIGAIETEAARVTAAASAGRAAAALLECGGHAGAKRAAEALLEASVRLAKEYPPE